MPQTTTADDGQARQLRDAMTGKPVKRGAVTSPAIEAAFRTTVPRHAFALPGTSLKECYHGRW